MSLRRPPLWSQLRVIGNSSLAKSTLAIPILGYLLLLSDSAVQWFSLHYSLCEVGNCGSLWRVKCLYFGGWCFAIGAIFYWWKCPDEVAKHADFEDFTNAETNITMAVIREKYPDFQYAPGKEVQGHPPDYLARIYIMLDMSRPVWRAILFGLYGAGAVLVSVPTGYTLYQVLLSSLR